MSSKEVKRLLYKMYPDSDPKYFKHFRFVYILDFKGGDSLEVYCKVSEESSFLITKGKNDKNPRWKGYLYGFNFPKIWRQVGTVQKFINHQTGPDRLRYISPHKYPYKLPYQLHNFRVYINDKQYFMSKLPKVSVMWSKGKELSKKNMLDIRKVPFDYKKEPYFAMISAAYIASYLCGISMEHWTHQKVVWHQIL